MSETFKQTLKITHVIEFDDIVHKLGRGMLGLRCNPDKVEVNLIGLLTGNTGEGVKVNPGEWIHRMSSTSMVVTVFGLLKSLGYSHIRNTLQQNDYCVYAVSNKVNTELANKIMDNKSDRCAYELDKKRQAIAMETKYTFVEYLDEKFQGK